MERSFKFDNIDTFYDWNLLLTAKKTLAPRVKTNYVELDGKDGTLDFTEALSGRVVYEDRTISATFWTNDGLRDDRTKLLRNILTTLHGKKVKIIEPDDKEHYLLGRVEITDVENILPYLQFNIEATCEPWRYSIDESVREVVLDGQDVDVIINNHGVKTLNPELNVTGSVNIVVNDNPITLTDGAYKISDLKLTPGVNVVKVSGNGAIVFKYREADI